MDFVSESSEIEGAGLWRVVREKRFRRKRRKLIVNFEPLRSLGNVIYVPSALWIRNGDIVFSKQVL